VEVYQQKITETKYYIGRYTGYKYNYDKEMAWCNNDIIDIENVECGGKMPSEYKAQIYIGSGFKFRDSIDLDQSAFTDDLYKVLENQYSKSVIKYDSYIGANLFTIKEFNPPNIGYKKIFKVFNWIGGDGLKEGYKEIDGYTSYFEKYGSAELGKTIETDPRLENNANFKNIENSRYFQYYFYGNDPNNPDYGDIRIQVLAIESKNMHSIYRLIGVASDNMLKPFNDHYIFNANRRAYEEVIDKYN
jgi:hypothetical protein